MASAAPRWGAPLVPVARIADDSTINLGLVAAVLALSDGGAVVIDAKATGGGVALLRFNASGRFVRKLGRQGGGPGEYGARIGEGDLAVGPDGTLLLYDGSNHRVDRWKDDGTALTPLQLPASGGCAPGLPPVVASTDGDLFVCGRVANHPSREVFERSNFGYVRLSRTGAVIDSILPPHGLRPFSASVWDPSDAWFVTSDGVVKVASDRLGFVLDDPRDGRVLSVVRPQHAVPFDRHERAEQLAFLKWSASLAAGFDAPTSLPENKPPFDLAWPAPGRRIWFRVHSRAVRVAAYPSVDGHYPTPPPIFHFMELPTFAAFSLDGTFLGDVQLPRGIQLVSFGADRMWGTVMQPDGTQQLVQWLLPVASTARRNNLGR